MEINLEDLIHSAFSFPTMIGLCFLGFGYMFAVGTTTSDPYFTYGSSGFFLSAILLSAIHLVDKALVGHIEQMEEVEEEPSQTIQPTAPKIKEVKNGIPKGQVAIRSFPEF